MGYAFCDTLISSTTPVWQCSEALSLDGQTIEDHVSGYRTLSVYGRESLDYSVTSKDRPVGSDGVDYFGKRLPGRTLRVRFELRGASASAFESQYRSLKNFCRGEDRLIRFADEPNKHYVGTLTKMSDPDEGALSIVGTMSFFCPDPYLVADSATTVTAAVDPDDGLLKAVVNNDSSGDVFPLYRITNNSENGYVGIVHAGGAFEMGNIEEADTEAYTKSEILFDSRKSGWSSFSAFSGTYPRSGVFRPNGTLKSANSWFRGNKYTALYIDNRGSASSSYSVYGGCRKLTLPNDSNGVSGAKDFYLYCECEFASDLTIKGQTGWMEIALTDVNDDFVCGLTIFKKSQSGGQSYVNFHIGGSVYGYGFTAADHYPPNMFTGHGVESIYKYGNKLRFSFNGKYYTYTLSSSLSAKLVKHVYVAIGQYKSVAASSTNKLVTVMSCGNMYFQKNNVEKLVDVPNRYVEGSEIVVDCENDAITIDGEPRNDELVTGSDFYALPPGQTEIDFYVSDFCEANPTVSVEFRKRWL